MFDYFGSGEGKLQRKENPVNPRHRSGLGEGFIGPPDLAGYWLGAVRVFAGHTGSSLATVGVGGTLRKAASCQKETVFEAFVVRYSYPFLLPQILQEWGVEA
jgi:hypothetical protein